MPLDLTPAELASLIDALDCLKTKIAFTKGTSYAEKSAQLAETETLEQKLRAAQGGA